MGVYTSKREEESRKEAERETKLIEEFLKRYEMFGIKTNKPDKPLLYIYKNGKFEGIRRDILKIELEELYMDLFHMAPRRDTINFAYWQILDKIPIHEPDQILWHYFDGGYRIPGVKNDLLVDKENRMLKVVERDRVHYPSIVELPYDFSKEPPKEMPPELKKVLGIVPPQYQDLFLYELVFPVDFPKRPFVLMNYEIEFSTRFSSLTAITRILTNLYDGLVYQINDVDLRFHKEFDLDILGRSTVIVNIYSRTLTEKVTRLAKSMFIELKEKYGPVITLTHGPNVILNVETISDIAPVNDLINSLVIIPITGLLDPYEINWDFETRERIFLWLIHNKLLPYTCHDLPITDGFDINKTVWKWVENKEVDYGLDEFVKEFIYEECAKAHSVIMSTDDAYQIYLKWAYGKYMPASQRQFLEKLGSSVKDGKVCVKKNAIASIFTGQ